MGTLGEVVDSFLTAQGCYDTLPLDRDVLSQYMQCVQAGYNDVPYHSVSHVLEVVRAATALWSARGLRDRVRDERPRDCDLLALAFVVAAAVHDLGHQGLSNEYMVRSGHDFAVDHNDVSPNESHHLATAFKLMRRHHFLCDMPRAGFRTFRETVIQLVMATDMAHHHAVLALLAGAEPETCAVPLLMMSALKCADLTHVFMEGPDREEWARRLQREWLAEGDRWRSMGCQPPPNMRPCSPSEFATGQMVFLRSVVIPFVELVGAFLPATHDMLAAASRNAAHWDTLTGESESGGEDRVRCCLQVYCAPDVV